MTIENYAEMLNAQKLQTTLTDIDGSMAKEHGFIILFIWEIPEELYKKFDGDARCRCSGAINGNVHIWETEAKHGNEGIYFIKGKLIKSEDHCDYSDCPFHEAAKNQIDRIRLHYSSMDDEWWFETEIPHATFNIYHAGYPGDDEEIYCKGIVIDTKNLKENSLQSGGKNADRIT